MLEVCSTGLTYQATGVGKSGSWQVLFSRLIIIGCSRSRASTVTTGLALEGESQDMRNS